MHKATLAASALLLAACSRYDISTSERYCEQLLAGDTPAAPFWAAFAGARVDGDAIRADFGADLDAALRQRLPTPTDRAAWVDGRTLHIDNPAGGNGIDAQVLVTGWTEGLQRALQRKTFDEADTCLYGAAAHIFDSVVLHTRRLDPAGALVEEQQLPLVTDRQARLGVTL